MQKKNQIRTPAPFKNKEDYIDDTNEKTRGPNDSPSETDGCARNLGEEYENEEDEEHSENTPEINDSIKSKISKDKTEEALIINLLAKHFSLKGTQEVIFSINTYEQDTIAVVNNKNN